MRILRVLSTTFPNVIQSDKVDGPCNIVQGREMMNNSKVKCMWGMLIVSVLIRSEK